MPTESPHPYFQLSETSGPQRPALACTDGLSEDQARLELVAERVHQLHSQGAARLAARGRDRAGTLQQSLQRDVEVDGIARRLRRLERMAPEGCLGFIVDADTAERRYIGRFGLSTDSGEQLLIDWRAAAAEPFFAASHANPMGLASRRRYRWRKNVVVDYWDEVFDLSTLDGHTRLDEQSSFLASLGAKRTGSMQDVLATIQSDQDAIIRRPAEGALVVDGGPGTGKTVVALHRAAYLMHADPRLKSRGGRILVLGPHDGYTAYVADVLPNLGEEEVVVSTLRSLVPESADARPAEEDPAAQVKASARMLEALRQAVTVFEQPPAENTPIPTRWGDAVISAGQWANAFTAAAPGTAHNDAREPIREALIDLLLEQLDVPPSSKQLARSVLGDHAGLKEALDEYWPLIDPISLLAELYSSETLLRYSAPWLDADGRRQLLRKSPRSWTESDLPLLDAARFLIGDSQREQAAQRRQARLDAEHEVFTRVIDDLLASADDMEDLSFQLMNTDLQDQLAMQRAGDETLPDGLQGPFTHIIIDEAQELSDAQWHMVLRRCPSQSLTIVGDRAQAREGFHESWEDRLARVGMTQVSCPPEYQLPHPGAGDGRGRAAGPGIPARGEHPPLGAPRRIAGAPWQPPRAAGHPAWLVRRAPGVGGGGDWGCRGLERAIRSARFVDLPGGGQGPGIRSGRALQPRILRRQCHRCGGSLCLHDQGHRPAGDP